MNNKRNLWIAVLAIALLALAGCSALANAITGSGNVVTREYDFTDFDEVDLSYAFVGNITQGEAYSIVVRVDDNLVDQLAVEQNDNRVSIGLKNNTLVTRATLEVDITMPNLSSLNVSGASQAQMSPFSFSDTFTVEASGASRVHGDVDAKDLELTASGASNITLAGTAGNVVANASGASKIDLEELTAVDAQTEASGASTIIVNIDGILDADASGASTITYLGNPTMGDIQSNGNSSVKAR